MKISVIIPLHESPDWIPGALASLGAQTLRPEEVIVVGDGSTDVPESSFQDFPAARVLRTPAKGPNAARRHGLEQAKHPFALMLDPDDKLHPEHLERLGAALLSTPSAPGAVSGAVPFQEDDGPEYSTWESDRGQLDPWEMFPINPIATPAQVLFRRQVLEDSGGWETRYPGAGGFHAWLTLTARRPFIRLAGQTVGQRQHAAGVGKPRRRNRWLYCDRYLTVAQNRVALRLRYHPSDGPRVKSRLRVARHLLAWRFADAMLSPRQTAPMALQVDQLLGEETPEWQQTLLDQAFLLFPVDERSTRLRKAVGWVRLYQRCPRDARHLRTALRQHLRRRFSGMMPPLDPA